MGFRRSQTELDAMQAALGCVEFVGSEALTLVYETSAAAVVDVLPDGLEPTAEPHVSAMVGRWRSNCVGDFMGATIGVAASHRGVSGTYMVSMFMDSDTPVLFGRDLFGEPKKCAAIELVRTGDVVSARVERKGVRLMDIEATLEEDAGPSTASRSTFNVRYELTPDGRGLLADPTLTLTEAGLSVHHRRPAAARLSLEGSPHDPLDSLPVLDVVRAELVEMDMLARCKVVGRLPGAGFLPLALGRMDYWPALSSARTGALARATEGVPR